MSNEHIEILIISVNPRSNHTKMATQISFLHISQELCLQKKYKHVNIVNNRKYISISVLDIEKKKQISSFPSCISLPLSILQVVKEKKKKAKTSSAKSSLIFMKLLLVAVYSKKMFNT